MLWFNANIYIKLKIVQILWYIFTRELSCFVVIKKWHLPRGLIAKEIPRVRKRKPKERTRDLLERETPADRSESFANFHPQKAFKVARGLKGTQRFFLRCITPRANENIAQLPD